MQKPKIALLTGAGFTKNFGGLLGDQIWSLIFSNTKIQADTGLKNFVLNNRKLGFEYIYGEILDSKNSFNPQQKSIIIEVLMGIYDFQETIISTQPENIGFKNSFAKFLTSFINNFFTLNQDLFIEKNLDDFLTKQNDENLELPQISQKRHLHLGDKYLLKSASMIDVQTKKIFYLKLHGSINWFDSKTGKNRVIIGGKNKESQIANEPLLLEYSKHFANCCKSHDYLIIIGYSFNDDHINQMLKDASNLKIIVIDKLFPGGNDLLAQMIPIKSANHLISLTNEEIRRESLVTKFCGYFPVESINELFSANTDTPMMVKLKETLGIA